MRRLGRQPQYLISREAAFSGSLSFFVYSQYAILSFRCFFEIRDIFTGFLTKPRDVNRPNSCKIVVVQFYVSKSTPLYLNIPTRNAPEELKQRVVTYLEQKYTNKRYFNEDQVLAEISKPIRDDIIR